jgi:hypothetical protein
MGAQREVVVLVPREARQVEHDHEMDAALIQPAEREQVLKLAAVGGLGALAFHVEAFEDFIAWGRQYSSHARSCVGRLRLSVCSFVLTRT